MLSYDYNTITTYYSRKIGSASGADVFGFYPKGKVKYICLNAKPSDFKGSTSTVNASIPSSVGVMVAERTEVENFLEKYYGDDYGLQNVRYETNKAAFSSNYSEQKLVVTTLGYDAGWKVVATLNDGTTQECKTYKLDGGFVGFVAPAGEVTYVMKYETPYLKEGAILASVAIIMVSGYTIGRFIYQIQKKKKEIANS